MRSAFLHLALSALVVANPVPQEIDIDMVMAAPDPTFTQAVGVTAQAVSYNIASIVADATDVSSMTVDIDNAASTGQPKARLARRGNCAAQPTGATGAPTYTPDTPSAFVSNTAFGSVASAAPTPSGYDQTFSNLQGSNNAYGYLGFVTLQAYDTQACASKCDKINGCMAVNIYFERDPSLDPGTNCPNPSSYTMIKCVFWGGYIDSSNAVNKGQWRQDFQVLIAGSNGYVNRSLATPPGYNGATYLGNAAINAPYDSQGYNTYMGSNVFTAGAFNASLCADYCNAQNKYNLAHPDSDGSPVQTCQFFNTYILYINKTSNTQGQYCAIYSEAWPSSYATNTGQYRGSDHYMIQYSYTFTNKTDPGAPNKQGAIYQARKDIKYSTLQSYCSTLLGYSTPLATTTVIATTTALTTASTTTVVTTTSTTYPIMKRQEDATTSFVTINTSDFPDRILPTAPPEKRAIAPASTPDVLTKYPASVVSSACMLVATAVTATSTITVSTTFTAATSTTVVTSSTTTTDVSVAQCTSMPIFSVNDRNSGGHPSCGCDYKESCGKINDAANCFYKGGSMLSYQGCAEQCDYYQNCGGFNVFANGDCIICVSNLHTGNYLGDGSSGVVAGQRVAGSCLRPASQCLYQGY